LEEASTILRDSNERRGDGKDRGKGKRRRGEMGCELDIEA